MPKKEASSQKPEVNLPGSPATEPPDIFANNTPEDVEKLVDEAKKVLGDDDGLPPPEDPSPMLNVMPVDPDWLDAAIDEEAEAEEEREAKRDLDIGVAEIERFCAKYGAMAKANGHTSMASNFNTLNQCIKRIKAHSEVQPYWRKLS